MFTIFQKILSWFRIRKKTWKELAIYAFQTYGTTAVSVVGAIIVIRLFDRAEYGMYGVIFSVYGILYTFFNGGVVKLANTDVLSAPLSEGQRLKLFSYVRNGYFWSTVLALVTAFFLLPFYGWKNVVYISILYICQQTMGFSGLIFSADMREHKLGKYYYAQSLIEYSRVTLPVLGVLVTRNLFGYFIGTTLALVFGLAILSSFAYWRKRLVYYAEAIWKADAHWRNYTDFIRLGLGMAFESGAATLYSSIIILVAASKIGLQETAVLKVVLGYFSAIGMVLLPFTRWVTLHLPRRVKISKTPFRELVKISFIGFGIGAFIYSAAIIVGPWLFPLVYGRQYSTEIGVLPYAGLFLLLSSSVIGMSVVSRMYNLSWKFAVISIINIFWGLLLLLGPSTPKTTTGFATFYGLWIIPALIASYALAYYRIPHRVDDP